MIEEKKTMGLGKQIIVGTQMLFVAFGALVLVPILTGLNSNVALFTAGAGTLIFQIVTKRKVPIFLASSFAFIAPIIYGVQTWGIAGTMSGLLAAGFVYILLAVLIRFRGRAIVKKVLPPVVVGPVIMVIGLNLAPVAVFMALGKTGDGSAVLFPQNQALTVAMISLLVTVLAVLSGKGMIRLVSILLGITAGYIVAIVLGMVNFSPVLEAPFLAVPAFVFPQLNWQAIFFIVPVAIAPAIEHIGDMLAISSVTGKNYLEDPGLHRTLMGDGIATSLASMLGGPPNTTYSEVTGAVTLTRAFNPAIMTWAACMAILLSFSGTLGAMLGTIPTPVMGGIMTLLFGTIAAIGMNTLVREGTDLALPRNLVIVSLILVFGIGDMALGYKGFMVQGIGLSAIVGVLLHLILPGKEDSVRKSA
ncbi:uracil-xanthine permease family protein [Desulfogranum marinum]|uniref:uracil-xanthine permease family protein n=1 Tax=Desulfogranum marinum TaxID=453220 RepID=UPI001962DE98|nr:uracil-xanthine permease family protein [Desulfogranum marinum]MBM9511723.1 uracil-xanthine permease [Desulfogranum marinum]